MVGRGAQGKPWFPGELARFLDTGAAPRTPALDEQFELTLALYEETLAHHGIRIGIRHARKHLAWALDTAAETAGIPTESLKAARARVLTSEEPAEVKRRLAAAYEDFAWKAAA
jgi:tRNA-dihydrouridine synthase